MPISIDKATLGPAHFGFATIPLPSDWLTVHQVHGTKIVDVTRDLDPATQADGMITNVKGLRLAIKTADCLPVLLSNARTKRIAAIHAGWRGLTAGILSQACAAMIDREGHPEDLHVAIGPAICDKCFEVGPEVVTALRETPYLDIGNDRNDLIQAGRDDRSYIDLKKSAVRIFANLGVPAAQVHLSSDCTLENPRWPSYRRNGKAAGRILSWIKLEE